MCIYNTPTPKREGKSQRGAKEMKNSEKRTDKQGE
jgi:hypothetical protein